LVETTEAAKLTKPVIPAFTSAKPLRNIGKAIEILMIVVVIFSPMLKSSLFQA
jgi:hypothetical protein